MRLEKRLDRALYAWLGITWVCGMFACAFASLGLAACSRQQVKDAATVAPTVLDAILAVLPLLGSEAQAETRAALDRGDDRAAVRIAAAALRAHPPDSTFGLSPGTADAVAAILALDRVQARAARTGGR